MTNPTTTIWSLPKEEATGRKFYLAIERNRVRP